MAKRAQAKELFTASEVAKFCQVDLKTIHNWADRGEIRHFRTPGRHLRRKIQACASGAQSSRLGFKRLPDVPPMAAS